MQIIVTERLILRPSTADEFESNYRVLVEEIEGVDFAREAYIPEFQYDLYLGQQNLGQQFGRPSIYLKDSQQFIGYCLLMPRLCTPKELASSMTRVAARARFSSIEAELGWAIANCHRNNGYATEAACALIDYGFKVLHLPRILAFTDPSNLASIRVMEKVGMHLNHHVQTGEVVGMIENEGRELQA